MSESGDRTRERKRLILDEVTRELSNAQARFPAFHSAHEGFAVILEEVDELKDEVWKSPKNRDPEAMRKEAVQVAAMALRFLEDCT